MVPDLQSRPTSNPVTTVQWGHQEDTACPAEGDQEGLWEHSLGTQF